MNKHDFKQALKAARRGYCQIALVGGCSGNNYVLYDFVTDRFLKGDGYLVYCEAHKTYPQSGVLIPVRCSWSQFMIEYVLRS